MTLWNPLNMFGTVQRRDPDNDVSASFDPSRTGDPIGRDYGRPAIGFGETGIGAPTGTGESRRRPIGFAPSDEDAEPRYFTELSFKRHHDAPRASVTADPNDESTQESWQTPEPDEVADVLVTNESPDGTEEPAKEKVPFYKREIGFRRKSAPSDGAAASLEGASPELADDAVESDEDIELFERLSPYAVAAVSASEEAEVEAVVDEADAEAHAELPTEHEDESELAIGAQHDVASGETEAELAQPNAAEDGVAKVPFYKREISFRRKNTTPGEGSDPVAVSEPEDADEFAATPEAHDDVEEGAVEHDAAVLAEVIMATADASDADPVDAEATAEAVADPFSERSIEEDLFEEPFAEPAVAAIETGADGDSTDDLPEVEVAAVQDVGVEAVDDIERADEELPVEDAALDPVAESDDVPGADEPSEADDLFIEDTPPSKRRRSSRKERRTAKTPKRKPSRGGGAKGRRVVGLKIGASQISAAVVVETEGGHELVDLARRPLAAGIVVDGEVKDIDALANALKAFFDEEKIPKKDVRIGLASNRIGVRTFDIVGIDDETRFDNAVRFKAHEVLPVAAHESVLDYRVLEERPNEAGEPTRRVLLVVAPRDQVEPYAEVANRAGIKLAGIDLEALGLLRAFADPKPNAVRAVDDTATVVVSIGHEASTLLVAGGGVCEFTRVFDWGGGTLVEAIATTLEVQPAEASTILKHLSLSGPGRQFDALDEIARAKALDAVRLRLTPFARELVASLQFYQTQEESLGIGGIVITGGTSHLEGLGEALNEMIGVNVSVGDPLARVISTAELDPAIEAIIGSMAVPIGLAIEDIAMRGVDLLPKDAVKTKSRRASIIAIGAPVAVAVPLVALGFLYLGAHGKVSDNQAELDAVKAEIAALPTPTGPDIDASVVGDEAVRATAVASVLGGRLAWDEVFRDMARVLPSNVWLTSLSASLPQGGNLADGLTAPVAVTVPGQAAAAPTAVVLEGYTYTQPDVARLLARLATLPSLRRVTLNTSQRETVGKKEVVRFVIVADLSQTGGAS